LAVPSDKIDMILKLLTTTMTDLNLLFRTFLIGKI